MEKNCLHQNTYVTSYGAICCKDCKRCKYKKLNHLKKIDQIEQNTPTPIRRTYKNPPEEAFCKWIEEKGFYPIKRGWPDFFCRNSKGEIILVEVKPYNRFLKKEQLLVMSHLSEYGIKCYRWDPVRKTLQPIKKISKLNNGEPGTSVS